jgi:DNA-directed RNA polymerase subunit alpha
MRKLEMPIAELDLSVRAGNCLESADICSVGELVEKDEPELLAVRSFGKTSLREVKRKLDELGLSLGMQLPERHQEPRQETIPEPRQETIPEPHQELHTELPTDLQPQIQDEEPPAI